MNNILQDILFNTRTCTELHKFWVRNLQKMETSFKKMIQNLFLTLKMKKYMYVSPMLIHNSSMKWDLSIFEYIYYSVVYLYNTPSYCYTSKIHK